MRRRQGGNGYILQVSVGEKEGKECRQEWRDEGKEDRKGEEWRRMIRDAEGRGGRRRRREGGKGGRDGRI